MIHTLDDVSPSPHLFKDPTAPSPPPFVCRTARPAHRHTNTHRSALVQSSSSSTLAVLNDSFIFSNIFFGCLCTRLGDEICVFIYSKAIGCEWKKNIMTVMSSASGDLQSKRSPDNTVQQCVLVGLRTSSLRLYLAVTHKRIECFKIRASTAAVFEERDLKKTTKNVTSKGF